jgi:glutathione peroxidase
MIKLLITGFAFILFSMTAITETTVTFHDFRVKTLEGEEFDLASLSGKKVMVVNTASKCGFTPQYDGLQALYDKYGGEDFTIVGFPANNFLRQEPGSDEDIREFCTEKYQVSFPMMSKISVKGKDIHPVYHWLTSKEENGILDSSVKWNFQKYMVDENGQLVGYVSSKTKPFDPEIISWIEASSD